MELVNVAKIGKSVGWQGLLKIHLLSDFPEVVALGRRFWCGKKRVSVAHYDSQKSLIQFENVLSKEAAQCFVGCFLQCSVEETREWCCLDEGYFFWFDMIGACVLDEDEPVGAVVDIQRIGDVDYLVVQALSKKTFLLPFIDRFVLYVRKDDDGKYLIYTQGAKDILEAS